jgi:hypothetical protein
LGLNEIAVIKEELRAVSYQEAPQEDAQEEASQDAEEDALAAATAG